MVHSVFFSNTVLNQIVTTIPHFALPTASLCKALQTCQASQGLVIIDPETQIIKFCLGGPGNKNSSYVTLPVLEDTNEHHYALFFVTFAQLSSVFLHPQLILAPVTSRVNAGRAAVLPSQKEERFFLMTGKS